MDTQFSFLASPVHAAHIFSGNPTFARPTRPPSAQRSSTTHSRAWPGHHGQGDWQCTAAPGLVPPPLPSLQNLLSGPQLTLSQPTVAPPPPADAATTCTTRPTAWPCPCGQGHWQHPWLPIVRVAAADSCKRPPRFVITDRTTLDIKTRRRRFSRPPSSHTLLQQGQRFVPPAWLVAHHRTPRERCGQSWPIVYPASDVL